MKQHDSNEYIIRKCSQVQIIMNGHANLNFLLRRNKKYRLIIWGMLVAIRDSITIFFHLLPKSINIPKYHFMGLKICLLHCRKRIK
jgi:hypothetical protein